MHSNLYFTFFHSYRQWTHIIRGDHDSNWLLLKYQCHQNCTLIIAMMDGQPAQGHSGHCVFTQSLRCPRSEISNKHSRNYALLFWRMENMKSRLQKICSLKIFFLVLRKREKHFSEPWSCLSEATFFLFNRGADRKAWSFFSSLHLSELISAWRPVLWPHLNLITPQIPLPCMWLWGKASTYESEEELVLSP